METWRRNVYAVAIAQFIALGGGNLVFPFMPFYVKELGVHGEGHIALWSGLLGTSTGLALFVFSPIWGNLADDTFNTSLSAKTLSGIAFAALAATSAVAALGSSRVQERVGRRNALALATLGAGAAYVPVAMANNALSLILLIGVVGLFSGAMVPAANALIDAWTPAGKQAAAFGLAGSAMALAFAVAPLSGGAVASLAGIHASFVVIGAVMLAVGFASFVLVTEPHGEAVAVLEPVEAID